MLSRSSATSSDSEGTNKLDVEEDQDWQDAEPDEEPIKFVSLFGKEVFDSVHAMLKHCKAVHHFDMVKVRNELGVSHLARTPYFMMRLMKMLCERSGLPRDD